MNGQTSAVPLGSGFLEVENVSDNGREQQIGPQVSGQVSAVPLEDSPTEVVNLLDINEGQEMGLQVNGRTSLESSEEDTLESEDTEEEDDESDDNDVQENSDYSAVEESLFIETIDVIERQKDIRRGPEGLFDELFCFVKTITIQQKPEEEDYWIEEEINSIEIELKSEKEIFFENFKKDLEFVEEKYKNEVKDMLWENRQAFSKHDYDIGTCDQRIQSIPTTNDLLAKRLPH